MNVRPLSQVPVLLSPFDDSDQDSAYLDQAKERLALLRRDGWRLQFLLKWFKKHVRQRRVRLESNAELKAWVFDRFRSFESGDREFRYRSFLRVLCIQHRYPSVLDRELMLAAMIVQSAWDFYEANGRF